MCRYREGARKWNGVDHERYKTGKFERAHKKPRDAPLAHGVRHRRCNQPIFCRCCEGTETGTETKIARAKPRRGCDGRFPTCTSVLLARWCKRWKKKKTISRRMYHVTSAKERRTSARGATGLRQPKLNWHHLAAAVCKSMQNDTSVPAKRRHEQAVLVRSYGKPIYHTARQTLLWIMPW